MFKVHFIDFGVHTVHKQISLREEHDVPLSRQNTSCVREERVRSTCWLEFSSMFLRDFNEMHSTTSSVWQLLFSPRTFQPVVFWAPCMFLMLSPCCFGTLNRSWKPAGKLILTCEAACVCVYRDEYLTAGIIIWLILILFFIVWVFAPVI